MQETSKTFGSTSLIFAPIFNNLSVKNVKWAGNTFLITALPLVAIIADINVPASILSGIVVYSIGCKSSCFTPLITISEVPAPLTSAPIVFKKFAKSTISGSCAAFCILVEPSAKIDASIRFSVAPTDGMSKYMSVPTSFGTFACT